ncbi:uncharacterized protein LOC106152486 isoform X1 [Lingula anatina]|uniref:Uncharacterized protein LOC106152486 isoform X1 n=1 Tax=Lingula anatina TaxID=7574 RepID=A0A2R2MPX9_LINAN|nr:uncharacterized protein LOC106152486 isoform X1 [Lingula anatina]|eukprot:XP_023932301.1 uncharacterized protein LOC106152486 isoform X1 [Lingula anatina]
MADTQLTEKVVFCIRCGTELLGTSSNFCHHCGAPSLQDTGGRQRAIERAITHLVRLSLCQIGTGTVSVIVGIVMLNFALPTGGWPLVSGSPIWSGIVVAAAGACGFATKYNTYKSVHNRKLRSLVLAHFGLSNLGITMCAFNIAFTGWSLGVCQGWKEDQCFPNFNQNLVMEGVNLVVGLMAAIFSIIGTSYICCFGRRFDVMVRPGYSRGVYYGSPSHQLQV